MKKVGKTTRLFRYDLNQIPYNYTVELRNRLKGLDLIKFLKNYGMRFVTLYRRQGSRPPLRKRNAKKAKWLSEEALNSCEKKRSQKQRRKGKKDIPIWMQSPKELQGLQIRKPSLVISAKK